MFRYFFIMYLREKGKKEVFTCMLLVFLPIFAPNKFPLLNKMNYDYYEAKKVTHKQNL